MATNKEPEPKPTAEPDTIQKQPPEQVLSLPEPDMGRSLDAVYQLAGDSARLDE